MSHSQTDKHFFFVQVMFRAGKLAELEDIREHALTVIMIKMQCHARKLLVKSTYEAKVQEKKGLFSIQRNIRLYLTCKVHKMAQI